MNKYDLEIIQRIHKTNGLIYAIKYIFNSMLISMVVWSCKNVKFVRNIIAKRIYKQSPYMISVFDLFVHGINDPDYFKKVVRKLPKDAQKQLVKNVIKQTVVWLK